MAEEEKGIPAARTARVTACGKNPIHVQEQYKISLTRRSVSVCGRQNLYVFKTMCFSDCVPGHQKNDVWIFYYFKLFTPPSPVLT